ncbi:hypothetical protein [Stenotrophomonas sp. 24(2023)]|uniref:hypothetical protein n=1 Tax=Stenotrophomonas sp. 24(2023) TaxID=3068324 RepID=UPI0027E1AD2E|nr:hypothetical protein [Stenotrophomonas sp. 24(2023)]WMJ70617.1 hypothetical protein Q9R17_05815 [Stenotrophomonas sp. 24(2023)]
MSDTGVFRILELQYLPDANGRPLRALSVQARCAACGTFSAWREQDIEHLPGGTVLACPACGVRQAISNARLSSGRQAVRHRTD